MTSCKAVLSLAVLLLATAPLALAQGTYTEIIYPGSIETICNGINDAGDIVGEYAPSYNYGQGFLLSGGVYTTIAYNGAYSVATGINNVGQVVGQYVTGNDIINGFLYDIQTQTYTTINYPGAYSTWPMAINDAGAIVGYYGSSSSAYYQGFEYFNSNYITIKPVFSSGALMWGITRAGKALGYSYVGLNTNFSFYNRKVAPLGLPAGYRGAGTNASESLIVGAYSSEGFVFRPGSIIFLQYPGVQGNDLTAAVGVNDSGTVVGYFTVDSHYTAYGFMWTPPAAEVEK